MNVRLFVGLLLAVGGFLAIYLAVALSFAAFYRDYVPPLVMLGVILVLFGVWLINPLGIWSKDISFKQ
jgi:xanthine/uracil permease